MIKKRGGAIARWKVLLFILLIISLETPLVLPAQTGKIEAFSAGLVADSALVGEPEPPAYGTLYGSVVSNSGARLPGAKITLTHQSSGAVHQILSGEMGLFQAASLAIGKYEMSIELPGFRSTSLKDLIIAPRISQTLTVKMEPSLFIEEYVTVIGSAPASSLESAEIRESTARDLGEALTRRAGLWRIRKGGIGNDIVLRGFPGRELNVLIDGQRVYGACPNNMDPAAFHVDFAEVDRVDIVKGPFDVKNEGGSGGSINVVTRKPLQSWRTRGNLATGSFGFINPSATLSYGGDKFSALGGFSYRTSGSYSDGTGKKLTESANYRSGVRDDKAFAIGTFWGKAGFSPLAQHQVHVSYARQQADHIIYPYLMMDADYDDTNRVGLRWEAQRLNDILTGFSVQTYYTEVSHWMTDRLRTSSETGSRGYSMGTKADTRTLGSKLETQLRGWTLGVEAYQRFWGASTEMAKMNYKPQFSLPDAKIAQLGLYTEYLKPFSDELSLTTGARVDRVGSSADKNKANTNLYRAYHDTESISGVDVFPSGYMRLDYRLRPGVDLGVKTGTAVQVPEPSERYFALKRKGTDWVGNPELSPSRSTGIEGTFSLEREGVFITGGPFFNRVDNFVTLYDQKRLSEVAGVTNNQARTYTNTDAELWGAELATVFPLEDRLFLSGDLSYVNGTKLVRPELEILSDKLAEIPPLRVRLNLRFQEARFFAAVEGVFSAAQRDIDTDLSEEMTPPYTIMNLSGGVRLGTFNFTAGVGNLFNRTYREHLSYQRDPFRSGVRVNEPGRSVSANLGVDF